MTLLTRHCARGTNRHADLAAELSAKQQGSSLNRTLLRHDLELLGKRYL
jgi:hypothetical protein